MKVAIISLFALHDEHRSRYPISSSPPVINRYRRETNTLNEHNDGTNGMIVRDSNHVQETNAIRGVSLEAAKRVFADESTRFTRMSLGGE
jgi:hypothetical protein